MKQFQPISLCNVVYKTTTKTIVNRLKPLLPKFMAPMQMSFISGRNISDNVIIYQEVLHSFNRKTGRSRDMMTKIDLEKAYVQLEWGFIKDTLVQLGLSNHLVEVIVLCVTASSFRILWNGETTVQIFPSRGLRQGDRLFPYLFVLCLERLGHIIDQQVEAGLWKPITASGRGT